MKTKKLLKSLKPSLISLMLILFLGISFSPKALFADRSLVIEAIRVDGQIGSDASMRVTESIQVDFSGKWNGFYVKIPQGDTPIVNVSVSENGQPYDFNPGSDYGPVGTYLVKDQGDDILIDWSIDANNEVRTFEVSYVVEDAVKIHNDVAELYRKFIGEANGNPISYVEVNLTLPDGADQYRQGEDIRIWGHGPLNGEIEFAGTNKVQLTVDQLPAYTFLEGRVLMPLDLFVPAQTAYTGQVALANILAEEEEWAKKANKERLMAKGEVGLGIGVVAFALGGMLLLWQKFGRRHKVNFDGDYYRDLPANYSPAELSYLWNFKKIQGQDIVATMLDLARRGFIFLQEDTVEVHKLLTRKELTTYKVSFIPQGEAGGFLRPHEKELMDYLNYNVGGGKGYIHLTDLESYAKKNGEAFYGFWQDWTKGIGEKCEAYDFFDHKGNMPLVTVLGGGGLMIAGTTLIAKSGPIGYGFAIAGAMFVFIPRFFKRRSPIGEEDYVRWQAFKKFLQDFSQIRYHEIPSLIIWEHYLVYAVTLGVAKEVIKQLEIVFPNMQDGDYRFGQSWLMYGSYSSMGSFNQSLMGISGSFDRSLQVATKAASKASSGSGGGGGFSGGGGGGGGGGSYGGR